MANNPEQKKAETIQILKPEELEKALSLEGGNPAEFEKIVNKAREAGQQEIEATEKLLAEALKKGRLDLREKARKLRDETKNAVTTLNKAVEGDLFTMYPKHMAGQKKEEATATALERNAKKEAQQLEEAKKVGASAIEAFYANKYAQKKATEKKPLTLAQKMAARKRNFGKIREKHQQPGT